MLNIYALNNIRDQKEINKFQIYKEVLKKCHHRIKIHSSKGESFCFYIIPEYIYGIPKYDTLNCANYIIDKLIKNGFKTIYTYPNLIYISWNHIPSEINLNFKDQLLINNKNFDSNSNNNTSQFRYIEDYKPSQNFIKRIINKKIQS